MAWGGAIEGLQIANTSIQSTQQIMHSAARGLNTSKDSHPPCHVVLSIRIAIIAVMIMPLPSDGLVPR